MVFSSHLFLFYFLPLVLLFYYVAPRKIRHAGLTVFSYFFYGWANPLFMLLMLLSTLIDYTCGLVLDRYTRRVEEGINSAKALAMRKVALLVSVCSNLALLAFFKYFNLFVESWNALVSVLHIPSAGVNVAFTVVLPLGISFYTFQSMSYTIDLYRRKVSVMRNFVDFACYVSLFPQLVAGPIIRFSEVADQLRSRTHSFEKFARGFAFLSLGLAKKVLLANACGKIADLAFGTAGIPVYTAWYGIVAYAFQIYYDFSGYSDMAIGLGLMLGFVFPKNFDSPYMSRSITEFWRRWHLSLSCWLRDYLYIPLGGNRKGSVRTYVNLMIVMLLGGLWHGASWNFLVWGGLHGSLLAVERFRDELNHRFPGRLPAVPGSMALPVTFFLVLVTWVFFRAADLGSAFRYLQAMFGLSNSTESGSLINAVLYTPYYLASFGAAIVCTWAGRQTWDWTRSIGPAKAVVVVLVMIVSVCIMTTQDFNPFIYFIF